MRAKARAPSGRSPVSKRSHLRHQPPGKRALAAHAAAPEATYEWTGSDEFSHLDDRKADPPVMLPPLMAPKRIVLVRHGQSTWNAEGRIQGSTDAAVLTQKGIEQARNTRDMVRELLAHLFWHAFSRRCPYCCARAQIAARKRCMPRLGTMQAFCKHTALQSSAGQHSLHPI